MKSALGLLWLILSASAYAEKQPHIIFMIGDGMGPAYTTAYRYYRDNPDTPAAEPTIFDALLVGMASTHPQGELGAVTDSAAAATALATGVKTANGIIGMDARKRPMETLLEIAKKQGYQTAMVVTSPVNHATPASFAAHIDSRTKYTAIADQYIDSHIDGKPKVDLLVGGGGRYFDREDRNILAEFEALGYSLAGSMNEFEGVQSLPAIALLDDDALALAIDSEDPTRLATLTGKALSLLGGQPFFMLVEGSQIDWCGHARDVACAMAEMHDFAEAVKRVTRFIDRNPDTLLVITADHSTGGLSLGAEQKYAWRPEVVKRVTASSITITKRLYQQRGKWEPVWERLTGITLSEEERATFQTTLDELAAAPDVDLNAPATAIHPLLLKLHYLAVDVISGRSHTGWTGEGHTGVDVQVFSYGKYAGEFRGHMDNTEIARKVMRYVE